MPEELKEFLKSLSPEVAKRVFVWLDELAYSDGQSHPVDEMLTVLVQANPTEMKHWPSS